MFGMHFGHPQSSSQFWWFSFLWITRFRGMWRPFTWASVSTNPSVTARIYQYISIYHYIYIEIHNWAGSPLMVKDLVPSFGTNPELPGGNFSWIFLFDRRSWSFWSKRLRKFRAHPLQPGILGLIVVGLMWSPIECCVNEGNEGIDGGATKKTCLAPKRTGFTRITTCFFE